jgi:16S rRNA (uracil1498-N3)-methyltransferase
MAAPRFFVGIDCAEGMEFDLNRDDAHHVTNVLRMQPGERLVAVDADGPWDAHVTAMSKGRVRVRAVGRSTDVGGELPVEIDVLQAVTRGAKFDEVVEKCVELGAVRIVPIACERSYAEATPTRVDRWRRIARSAAQQSRRRIVPFVAEPLPWSEAVRRTSIPLIVGWEGAERGTLAAALHRIDSTSPVAIAIGPEGSFTEDELEIARAAKAELVSLGPMILRTQTAAAALIAAMAAVRGWW